MTVDTDDPVDAIGDQDGNLRENIGNACDLRLPFFGECRRRAFEEHFRRKHKPVADNLNFFTISKHLPHDPEEFGAEVFQISDLVLKAFGLDAQAFSFGRFKIGGTLGFLSCAGQRGVQLRAKSFDAYLCFSITGRRSIQKRLK